MAQGLSVTWRIPGQWLAVASVRRQATRKCERLLISDWLGRWRKAAPTRVWFVLTETQG